MALLLSQCQYNSWGLAIAHNIVLMDALQTDCCCPVMVVLFGCHLLCQWSLILIISVVITNTAVAIIISPRQMLAVRLLCCLVTEIRHNRGRFTWLPVGRCPGNIIHQHTHTHIKMVWQLTVCVHIEVCAGVFSELQHCFILRRAFKFSEPLREAAQGNYIHRWSCFPPHTIDSHHLKSLIYLQHLRSGSWLLPSWLTKQQIPSVSSYILYEQQGNHLFQR